MTYDGYMFNHLLRAYPGGYGEQAFFNGIMNMDPFGVQAKEAEVRSMVAARLRELLNKVRCATYKKFSILTDNSLEMVHQKPRPRWRSNIRVASLAQEGGQTSRVVPIDRLNLQFSRLRPQSLLMLCLLKSK